MLMLEAFCGYSDVWVTASLPGRAATSSPIHMILSQKEHAGASEADLQPVRLPSPPPAKPLPPPPPPHNRIGDPEDSCRVACAW